MANFYCEYCGDKFPSIQSLTASSNGCSKHPQGTHKGRHKLYEGSEKTEYFCKYCGDKFSSIQSLTAPTNGCSKHPEGQYKGRHAVAL